MPHFVRERDKDVFGRTAATVLSFSGEKDERTIALHAATRKPALWI